MVNLEKLLNAGFLEIPSREMWYSRERRMAFSDEAILNRVIINFFFFYISSFIIIISIY